MSDTSTTETRPNRTLSVSAVEGSLAYALHTDPSPLTVSLAGQTPEQATLEVVLTNEGTAPLEISSFALTLKIGAAAADLASTSAGVGCSVSDDTNWSIAAPATVESGSATWYAVPDTGSSMTLEAGDSLVVELNDVPVNEEVGTSIVTLEQTLADGGTGSTAFYLTKYPHGFYFDGLVATVSSGSGYTPAAQVANGTPVTLLWNGSVKDASAYTVRYSTPGGEAQAAVSVAGEWSTAEVENPTDVGLTEGGGLTADTVFVVEVDTTEDGEAVTYTQTTGVAVAKPDLVAASVSADGGVDVGGDASIAGLLSAGTLSAGNATVEGDLTVTGAATVTGALDVSGDASLARATVAGLLQATAAVQMIGTPVYGALTSTILSGTLTADTDGFLLASVYPPAVTDAVAAVVVTLSWTGGGGTVFANAVGGNLCIWGEKHDGKTKVKMWKNPCSPILPVPKGTTVTCKAEYYSDNEIDPPVILAWVPLGATSATFKY